MCKTNDSNVCQKMADAVIELGVASVETKGGGGAPIEEFGLVTLPGISED
ncbi:benenodin family lasso peptide [Luteimonas sp. SDU82]